MKDLWTHRKFILNLLAFAAVFFAVNALVNSAYTRWSRQTVEYEISRRQFEAMQEQVSVVFIGDSHVLSGVNPVLIEGSYNFGFDGENTIEEYYKYKYYLERGWKPEVAVIQIDLHTLSSFKSERFRDPAFWKQYVDYLEVGLFKGRLQSFLKLRLMGEFAYMGELEYVLDLLLDPKQPKKFVSGFEGGRKGNFSVHNDSKKQELAATRASNHFEGHQPLDPDLLAYFLRMVDLLETHGVKVVLVRYPVTEWYGEESKQYVSVKDFYRTIEDGLTKNDSMFIMLDYHDLFWGQDELFLDSDHLNATGAEQISIRIKEDLDRLGVFP